MHGHTCKGLTVCDVRVRRVEDRPPIKCFDAYASCAESVLLHAPSGRSCGVLACGSFAAAGQCEPDAAAGICIALEWAR